MLESMDINQGKLILGLDILNENDLDKYTALIYNAILGGIPTSKMFQNVREKNSLAYTASSSFVRQKANVYIKCGIDIENYEKVGYSFVGDKSYYLPSADFVSGMKKAIDTYRAITFRGHIPKEYMTFVADDMLQQILGHIADETGLDVLLGYLSGKTFEEAGNSILDRAACSNHMKQAYQKIGRGVVCGICVSVCPAGRKNL